MAFSIRIISPGKTKKYYLQEAISDYLRRLSHYVSIDLIEVPAKIQKQNLSPEIILEKETEVLLKYLKKNYYLVVLDVTGKMISSEMFAAFLQGKRDTSIPGIDFVIGGEWGISEKIKKQAKMILSLSRMTFTHDITRLLLLEQIYRAFTILQGEKYHK